MKRLLFLIMLFCAPAFADELPIVWFEAGKQAEISVLDLRGRWELRNEHRILDGGTVDADPGAIAVVKIKIPPINPGQQMRAKLFFNGEQNSEVLVLIVSPDPFEDRKGWFAKHPIALYDPVKTTAGLFEAEKTTAELFEAEEIPFKRLRSFADIETVEKGVIIIGAGTDFDRERGLAEALFEYASKGGNVYVASPIGSIPLQFPAPIDSLVMVKQPKHLFPDTPEFFRRQGYTWTLTPSRNQVMLVREFVERPEADGTTVVDIHFRDIPDSIRGRIPGGRIVFDCFNIFQTWEGWISSRWYFKSLIETLTNE